MAFHIFHQEHYILLEPESGISDHEEIEEVVQEILGNSLEVNYVILDMGTMDYIDPDDLEQWMFLNDELVIKGGHLQLVCQAEHLKNQVKDKILTSDSVDEAIDLIESEKLDSELFSEES